MWTCQIFISIAMCHLLLYMVYYANNLDTLHARFPLWSIREDNLPPYKKQRQHMSFPVGGQGGMCPFNTV